MYVLPGGASVSGLELRMTARQRDSSRFAKSNSKPPQKKQTRTAAAAEAIATHGLLTHQSPPQFVHDAMSPNSPRLAAAKRCGHDAPQSQDADCGGTALGRDG